jgi:putative replication protein
MKNIATENLLGRLGRIIPPGVQPRFTTVEEWRNWQAVESEKRAAELDRLNQKARAEKILGRSGIQRLHQNCTFRNYEVTCDGQRDALGYARSYAVNFGSGFASFVFTGNSGTGKNHLAAAIGNHLMAQGRTVLIVTVPDLMARFRACYDGNGPESALLEELTRVDLLVLDEVGIQRDSAHEKIILNQIIDKRLASMRPVGVLTNLNHAALLKVLGDRILDRLRMDDGLWVSFDWGSYRGNVSHLRHAK